METVTRSIEYAIRLGQQPSPLLLAGPPGCGKTSYATRLAQKLGANLVYHMLHSWSDDQELYCGVDIRAAVAGEADQVRQPGVLAVAAEASQHGLVVLCLDEVDKSPDRVEYLLLDYLETGRVPIRPGHFLVADRTKLIAILTTNDVRPLSDALLRRCRRVRMQPIPLDRLVEIVAAERPQLPIGMIRLLARSAQELSSADQASLTVPELRALVDDCAYLARNHHEVREYLSQWAARGEEGRNRAAKAQTAPIWAEITQWRRQGGASR